MSYQPAIRISDHSGLERLGAAPAAVLAVLARAYAKQVFVDGLFHADPHPGNLFVLDEPDAAARPRVLFVDFGLSRRLDPTLRRELRTGIYALLQGDLEGFLATYGEEAELLDLVSGDRLARGESDLRVRYRDRFRAALICTLRF